MELLRAGFRVISAWVQWKLALAMQWLWRLLPDRCQAEACLRKGMRGNEQSVGAMRFVCDYCHADYMVGLLPIHAKLNGRMRKARFNPYTNTFFDAKTGEEIRVD